MLIRRDRALLATAIMLDIAFHGGRTATVNAGDIAERLGTARRGLEPLLQSLARAGLLESLRGPRGGYRLGRGPRHIHLSDIAEIATAEAEAPEGPTGRLQSAVLDGVWSELDQAAQSCAAALSLHDLLRRAAARGLHRPSREPISFAI